MNAEDTDGTFEVARAEEWPEGSIELTERAWQTEKITDALAARIHGVSRAEIFDAVTNALEECAHEGAGHHRH